MAALGSGWAKPGHNIVFGVRDVNKADLKAVCTQIGATAAPSADAAQQGDAVVLALPWSVAETAVKSLGDLRGKVVIDCVNPLAMKDGALGLDRGYVTPGGEAVASWLPGAKVVKTFNQVGADMMTAGDLFETRPVMFLAGEDEAAKATVAQLVTELGFEALDAGGSSERAYSNRLLWCGSTRRLFVAWVGIGPLAFCVRGVERGGRIRVLWQATWSGRA